MTTAAKAGIGLIALAAVGIGWQAISANQVPDQILIERALEESIKASREGRPGSVLDLLSQQFKVNDGEMMSRMDIAKAIRDYKPEVTLGSKVARVQGDAAAIVTPVTLTTPAPFTLSFTVPEATLEFQKESGVKWLIIPEKRWRLTKVTVPESALQGLQ